MINCKPRYTPCKNKLKLDQISVGLSANYHNTCVNPAQHRVTAKHALRYLKGTVNQELCYKRSDANLKLAAYSDADWAADQTTECNWVLFEFV